MSKRLLFLLVAVLALSGIAAGCGNDEKATTSNTTSMSHSDMENTASSSGEGEGVDSGSAELRAGLTSLLEEHVYLAGISVANGVGNGLDSKQFKAAAATLDDNSKALADAIGSVYGDDAGAQFLSLWRKHIGFFVTYTKGLATKNPKLAAKAQKQLDGYRTDFGAFIASAN